MKNKCKYLLSAFILLLCTYSAFAAQTDAEYTPGYLCYDAIALKESADAELRKKILAYYDVKKGSVNVFLKDYEKYCLATTNDGVNAQLKSQGIPILNAIGNVDVTNIVQGLARFFAERAKDELSTLFFKSMKEKIKVIPELQALFPTTTSFLNTIEEYSYASMIQVLKESFETDINNLPASLYKIKDLDTMKCNNDRKVDFAKDCKEITDFEKCGCRMEALKLFFNSPNSDWLQVILFTLKESQTMSNPAELLNTICSSSEFARLKPKQTPDINKYNLASSLQIVNIISKSLLSKNTDQIWIPQSILEKLLKDPKVLETYIGLLLTRFKADKIQIWKSISELKGVDELLNDTSKVTELKYLFQNLFNVFRQTNNAAQKILSAGAESSQPTPEVLHTYYTTVISAFRTVAHDKLLKDLTGDVVKAKFDEIEKIMTPAINILYHISTRKYSATIFDALSVLKNINSQVLEMSLVKTVVKYGTFIGAVASASNSDEVKQAIEASVLPSGSYTVKSQSVLCFNINSYVGGSQATVVGDKINEGGFILSAPIGFDFSLYIKPIDLIAEVNFQLFDIGALVEYYSVKGDTAMLPNDYNIKLSNVVSPGVNLFFRFSSLPVSIGTGLYYKPHIYTYEQILDKRQLITEDKWMWRVGIFLDLPLWSIPL